MTIYVYHCADDAVDQLACDNPNSPQAYRITICGGGNAERCLKYFPYVVATKDEQSISRTWRVVTIDPMTGRFAADGQPGALHV